MSLERIPDDEARSILGEGIHTSLRKGAESPESSVAWRAIRDMDDWSGVLRFLVSGLDSMGICLARERDD